LTRKKLLILDDNASFAESLCDVLSQQGFDVRWAAQASDAHALATASGADVLLVDVNLGAASGIEVAQQFYRENLVRGVVFMTGSIDMNQNDIPELLKKRSVVLHKPVDKETLLNAIASLSPKASGSSIFAK
jgi:two-component system, OmpR family, response regulator RstA